MNLSEWDLIQKGYRKDRRFFILDLPKSNRIIVELYDNGNMRYRRYDTNCIMSRDPADGPAYESWRLNGMPDTRHFLINGNYSRDPKEGPAVESFGENGNLIQTCYFIKGRRLRKKELALYGLAEKTYIPL